MILTAFIAAFAGLYPSNQAVQLARVFKAGEKLTYEVRSSLSVQERERGLQTWIPSDFDMNYKFTIEVKGLKSDGVAEMIYKRPTMTVIDGETVDSPPKTNIEKVNYNMQLSVSPANEILAMKDLNPPKKDKPKSGGGLLDRRMMGSVGSSAQLPFLSQFISEVHRLALFAGNFESSLDFAPRLPFEKLSVGDTWKRTVGYSPQKLKGKNGKTVNQRLDYVFTYKGVVDSNGKKVYRVTGSCLLDSNLADFIHETFEVKSDETGLKSIPLQLKTLIDFDLDMTTQKTLRADATSEGGFKIIITAFPDDPVQEETFKGRTQLRLIPNAPGKPGK